MVSLAYSFYFQVKPLVDARAYDNIAWNIAQGNGYRENLNGLLSNDQSIIRVGPGYEFFLAGIFYLFGHRLSIVWLAQAILMAFSFWLMYLTGQEVFKGRSNYHLGIVAAILIGFSPDLITLQSMLMTELLGVFLLILSVYLFFKYYNDVAKSFWKTFLLGLFLGAAGLVRTPALFLFVPMAGYFIWIKEYKKLIIFVISVAVLFIPWTVRNYEVFGKFIPTNAAGGYNLLTGNHLGASGEQGDNLSVSFEDYVNKFGYVGANDKATSQALHFIKSYPIEFAKITLKRVSIYFSFARPTGFWFHLHGLSKALTLILSSAYSIILFILGFWGILQTTKLEQEDKIRGYFLLGLLVMMPISIIGIVVETRYRFLSYPFFALFAGLAVEDILKRRILLKPALLVAGLLLMNTAFDVFRNLDRIFGKIHTL